MGILKDGPPQNERNFDEFLRATVWEDRALDDQVENGHPADFAYF